MVGMVEVGLALTSTIPTIPNPDILSRFLYSAKEAMSEISGIDARNEG
jgi:hypothetical protein